MPEVNVIKTNKIIELSREMHTKLYEMLTKEEQRDSFVVLREIYSNQECNGRTGMLLKATDTSEGIVFVVENPLEEELV